MDTRDAKYNAELKRRLSVSARDVVDGTPADPYPMWEQDPFEFDEKMTEYYLHHYFTKINNTTYCMFPRASFMNWVRICRHKTPWDTMLLYAMMAHGTIFATNSRKHADGNTFSRIAHRAIGESPSIFNLQVVQTCLILALYDFSQGNTSKALEFTFLAIRAACGMKLNVEEGVVNIKDDQSLDYGLDKSTLIECRRRTFWSTYIMDRFNVLFSAHLSMSHIEESLLRLPCNEKMYEVGNIPLMPFWEYGENSDLQQYISSESNALGTMAYLVQIASIWGEVLVRAHRWRYRFRATWGVSFEKFYQQTIKRLEAWERSLSADLRYSPGNIDKAGQSGYLGSYAALHTLYHCTIMKLNRHARYDTMARQQVDRNVKCAYEHACKTLNMMKAIAKQKESGNSGNFGFAVSNPFMGFAVLTAIDILTATASWGVLLNHNSRLNELLAGGIDMMTELSEHWSSAKTQLKLVEDRFQNLMATVQSHGSPEHTKVTAFFAKDPLDTTFGLGCDLVYALPRKRYLEALGWCFLAQNGDEMVEVLTRGSLETVTSPEIPKMTSQESYSRQSFERSLESTRLTGPPTPNRPSPPDPPPLYHLSDSNQNPERVAQACSNCRRFRIICDERRPACISCEELDLPCIDRHKVVSSNPGSPDSQFSHEDGPHSTFTEIGLDSQRPQVMNGGSTGIAMLVSSSPDTSSGSATSSANTTFQQTEASSSSLAVSTVDSEGERSFVYASGDDDHYWSVRADEVPSLSTHLAGLALKEFVKEYCRVRPVQSGGSSIISRPQQGQLEPGSSSSTSLAAGTTSNYPCAKQPLDSQEGSEDSDGQEDGRNAKKQCRSSSDRTTVKRLFACPYYRFDLDRYSERNAEELCYRGCASVCPRDISRLKQHLYRVHRRPDYYCGSCYRAFKAQAELDAHARQRPACEIVEPLFQEKMDKDQTNLIKRRNARALPHNEWFNIYKILFPDADQPPISHAYADGNSSEVLQNFWASFEAEAPTMLSSLVRNHLRGRILVGEETQNVLDEAFEHAASRLVELLRPRIDVTSLWMPQADDFDGQGQDTNVSSAGAVTQELPVLEHTLDFHGLDFEIAPEQWFDPNYMD